MTNQPANKNRKWWVLAGATLLYLATTADGPNFKAALPSIQEYFDASISQVQLLTTVAQLCVAAFVGYHALRGLCRQVHRPPGHTAALHPGIAPAFCSDECSGLISSLEILFD